MKQRVVGRGVKAAVIINEHGRASGSSLAIFLHSWQPDPPNVRAQQLTGLVRRGYTVIYPAYRDDATGPEEVRGNAIAAIHAAVGELPARPDRVLLIGEVVGGLLAFDIAALAAEHDLPRPDLLVALQPGPDPGGELPATDHSKIDPATRILVATSTSTRAFSGPRSARGLLAGADRVPPRQKTFFLAEPPPNLDTAETLAAAHAELDRAVSGWLESQEGGGA